MVIAFASAVPLHDQGRIAAGAQEFGDGRHSGLHVVEETEIAGAEVV